MNSVDDILSNLLRDASTMHQPIDADSSSMDSLTTSTADQKPSLSDFSCPLGSHGYMPRDEVLRVAHLPDPSQSLSLDRKKTETDGKHSRVRAKAAKPTHPSQMEFDSTALLFLEEADSKSMPALKSTLLKLQDRESVSKRYSSVKFTWKHSLRTKILSEAIEKKEAAAYQERFGLAARMGLPSRVRPFDDLNHGFQETPLGFSRVIDEVTHGRIADLVTTFKANKHPLVASDMDRYEAPIVIDSGVFYDVAESIFNCEHGSVLFVERTQSGLTSLRFRYNALNVAACQVADFKFNSDFLTWEKIAPNNLPLSDSFPLLARFSYVVDLGSMEIFMEEARTCKDLNIYP